MRDRAKLKALARERGYVLHPTPNGQQFWLESEKGVMEFGDFASGCLEWLLERSVQTKHATRQEI